MGESVERGQEAGLEAERVCSGKDLFTLCHENLWEADIDPAEGALGH